MNDNQNSRRRFLKTATLGASAAAFPLFSSRNVLGAGDSVRLAQIGCGGRGSHDMRIAVKVPRTRFVAVCELRDDRLKRAQEIATAAGHNPKPYKDFRKMIEAEELDGVIAVVEVQNHANVVIPILEANINTFTEKPMDLSIEATDRMVRAARTSKAFLQVGFQRRYSPQHRACVMRIHAKELGPVTHMQAQWHWTWDLRCADAEWDGGRLIEQAVHHMDVMSWVMRNKPPVTCVAMGSWHKHPQKPKPKHVSEDMSSVSYQFEDGTIFSYSHLFTLPEQFTGEKLWVVCERGGFDLKRAEMYSRDGNQTTPLGRPLNDREWDNGTREEFAGFVEHCRSGTKPLSDHETGKIATLMSIMGRRAMYDRASRTFTPRIVTWEDLGSKT